MYIWPLYHPKNRFFLLNNSLPLVYVDQTIVEQKKIDIRIVFIRSQRRKWIHCFDDVNGVIFVAALSDYLLKLDEAHSVNRMTETLKVCIIAVI